MTYGNLTSKTIKVCHIAHGDLWAGAEVQLATFCDIVVNKPGFELSVVLLNEGRLADTLRTTGINAMVLSESKYNSVQLFIRLVRYLRQYRPDIVHTHKYKDNILGSCASVIAGIPVVVRSVHGLTEPFRGREYVNMALYEIADRLVSTWKVKKIIGVSENITSVLKRLYGAGKVVCIHNGIDLKKVQVKQERAKVRQCLGVGSNECVVGTVGRLTTVKGHDIMIQTARLLKNENVDCKFLIVGDGPLMLKLKALAQTLGIEKEVILAGQRDDVYDLINAMDIFLLPSLHEGIPMVLLESLALGCPVIASRVGGIPEIVSHGKEGLLVEPGRVEELKENVSLLIKDRTYADKLSKAGRQRVEEVFSGDLMVEQTVGLYSALVAHGATV